MILLDVAVGLAVLLACVGYGGWSVAQVVKWQREVRERRELVKSARRWENHGKR